MERGDFITFGKNVRAFRALRGWGVRELAERADVSSKTIVKVERGEGCTPRIEQKIVKGFSTYQGRLWDKELLSDDRERVILREKGRWFFSMREDAERYFDRLRRGGELPEDDRFRTDPDAIQIEAERHRLGHTGLAAGFVRAKGGGMSTGYFLFNQAELFGRDITPRNFRGMTVLIHVLRGSLRMGIRNKVYELNEGDSIVVEQKDGYWSEPCSPVRPGCLPPLAMFVCLGMLSLKSGRRIEDVK